MKVKSIIIIFVSKLILKKVKIDRKTEDVRMLKILIKTDKILTQKMISDLD